MDSDLLKKMEAENVVKLSRLQEVIEDAEKNFGETEQRDALLGKAGYLCKIGDKVRKWCHFLGSIWLVFKPVFQCKSMENTNHVFPHTPG